MIKTRMHLQSNVVTARNEDGSPKTRNLGFVQVEGQTALVRNATVTLPVQGDVTMDDSKVYELSITAAK